MKIFTILPTPSFWLDPTLRRARLTIGLALWLSGVGTSLGLRWALGEPPDAVLVGVTLVAWTLALRWYERWVTGRVQRAG